MDACQQLGLDTVFEPGKMHPKDWANPGRVRVELKSGRGGARRVKNSVNVQQSSDCSVNRPGSRFLGCQCHVFS